MPPQISVDFDRAVLAFRSVIGLEIPEDHKRAFHLFLEMAPAEREKLVAAFERAKPRLLLTHLALAIAKDLSSAPELLGKHVEMLTSMGRTLAHAQPADTNDFVDQVYRAAIGTAAPTSGEWLVQREQLVRSFRADAVAITGKAFLIAIEHPRTLCDARVLSELRPVFSDDLKPRAMVATHQLRLVAHVGPDRKQEELYVALDAGDLRLLRAAIDRALDKHAQLRSMSAGLALPFLEPEGGDA